MAGQIPSKPHSCTECKLRFSGLEALRRHEGLDHTADREYSGWEDLLVEEPAEANSDGRPPERRWRRKTERLITPPVVFAATGLGLAYGLLLLGLSIEVLVALFLFTVVLITGCVMWSWTAGLEIDADNDTGSNAPES
jgi:hypothetical protein